MENKKVKFRQVITITRPEVPLCIDPHYPKTNDLDDASHSMVCYSMSNEVKRCENPHTSS